MAFGVLAAAPSSAIAAGSDTVWLCKPGATPNPCRESLETTVVSTEGDSQVENPPLAKKPKFDCFYVYPTVSGQPTTNADLTVDPEQTAIAEYQASRFSRRCRVYAPMYRQLTLASIFAPQSEEELQAAAEIAYSDVRAAWRDYLKHYNHGRGVVLIGHSQGTFMLRALVHSEIDPKPAVRKRLVSAILLGGNVTVKRNKGVGGDFRHIPACTSRKQTGCVIAFSTFNETPPDDTRFGKPGSRFGDAFGLPNGAKLEVLCTNPAGLPGGAAPLDTFLRTEPFPGLLGAGLTVMFGGPPPTAPTPWLQPQDHYTGECVEANDANVLMISPVGSARHLNPSPDSTWGLHLADVNIALGNLVDVVRSESKAYLKREARNRR